MKALGKDVWDFYLNGFPQEYSHDTWTIQVAYWPDENSARGAYSLLEDDKEYDLKDFGTLWNMVSDKSLSFEEAYLKWKGVEKPAFYEWFDEIYSTSTSAYEIHPSFKAALEMAWNAAIASTKES